MTIAMRTWTCKGCEYSDKQVGTYYQMKKSWDTIHTLQFCKDRKINNAFHAMFPSLDKLDILTILPERKK
jgi:hypothetical protein